MADRKILPKRRSYMQCTGGHVSEVTLCRMVPGGFEWRCSQCENWNLVHETHACQFVGFWHPHLGHKPVFVDSWKTYRQELGKCDPKWGTAQNELAS